MRKNCSLHLWLTLLMVFSTCQKAPADAPAFDANSPVPASQNQTADVKPEQLLNEFKAKWDAEKWAKRSRGKMYMRPIGEVGWKVRMTTLRSLVLMGKASVPALITALDSDHDPTRVLAAQALSFLAPHADLDRVQTSLAEDKNAAVRLYAADTIGMSGKTKGMDWKKLADPQRNRDVRKHISYASERGNHAISDDVITTMNDWKPSLMDTAKVGSAAPDFRLKTIDGKQISLSDYRGKQSVVLVFIYGDT